MQFPIGYVLRKSLRNFKNVFVRKILTHRAENKHTRNLWQYLEVVVCVTPDILSIVDLNHCGLNKHMLTCKKYLVD